MVLLLGSRGQYKGRNPGFVGNLRRIGGALLQMTGLTRGGNARRGETRASRGSLLSGWVALGGALACFGVGYLVGHSTAPSSPGSGASGLQANGPQTPSGPQTPTMIGEADTRPLTSQAFIVSAYPSLDATEAKQRAKALSDWLHGQQLQKARPYEFATKSGPVWVVAVYYDGEKELGETRDRLRQLPEDAPDATFVQLRKTDGNWPKTWAIQ